MEKVKPNQVALSSRVKFVSPSENQNTFIRPHKKHLTIKPNIDSAFISTQSNEKPIRVKLASFIEKTKVPLKKQKTLKVPTTISEYVSKPQSNIDVHLPKLPTPNLMNIINPLDISFGNNEKVNNNNYEIENTKTFHKMKTYLQNENTCNTSHNYNLLTTDEGGNKQGVQSSAQVKSPLKKYQKTKTFSHRSRKKHHHTNGNSNDYSPSLNKHIPKYPNVKYSSHSVGKYIKAYAVNSYQGVNNTYNSDKVSLILTISKPKVYSGKWPQCSYLAIYDGYNGSSCSDFLRDYLHQYIVKNVYFPEDPQEALITGLKSAENVFFRKEIDSGAYAVVTLLINEKLYISNLGKCKVILSLNKTYEVVRCEGKKYFGNRKKESEFPVINTENEENDKEKEPSISIASLDNKCVNFMIMGSVGLFETLAPKECVEISWDTVNKMRQRFDNIHSLSGAVCDRLIKTAIKRGSKENITCVFVAFENYENKYNEGNFLLKGSDGILTLNYRNKIKKPILKLKVPSS